jgi:hypothetical protein
MWNSYSNLNPHVTRVLELFEKHENGPVKNDHIAIRTFNHPRVNREVLAQSFLNSGYKAVEDLKFEKKKLDATYYLHEDENLTRVFISELKLEEFSDELQATVNRLINEIPNKAIEQFDFCNSGTPWNMITKETYDFLKEESEYAAWVATFGFIVNHFTISVTDCKSFENLEQVNAFLTDSGFRINDSGGEIKGSVEQGLEQSSIMSEDVGIQFSPVGSGKTNVPGCYYEFALRHNNFDGFIAGSADKIFESTDNTKLKSKKSCILTSEDSPDYDADGNRIPLPKIDMDRDQWERLR